MKYLIFLCIPVLLLVACDSNSKKDPQSLTKSESSGTNKETLLQTIHSLEKQVFEDDKGFQKDIASQLLLAYIDFSNNYFDDDNRCDFTLKAAQLAQGLQKYRQAIKLYQNVSGGCQNYEMQEEAYFMIAVIYQDFLNDREQAKKYYENFIADFPDHHLAEDAQARIDMLYMTDEEIIEHFKALNAEK